MSTHPVTAPPLSEQQNSGILQYNTIDLTLQDYQHFNCTFIFVFNDVLSDEEAFFLQDVLQPHGHLPGDSNVGEEVFLLSKE